MPRSLGQNALRRSALLVLASLVGCAFSPDPEKRNGALDGLEPTLSPEAVEVVAELPTPPGNLAIAPDGRVFFTFHPEADPDVHLAELLEDGTWRPFPSAAWQTERDDGPWFTTPLGVRIGADGRLWVLDHGDYGSETPSLTVFDLEREAMLHRFEFPGGVANWGSMLNDLAVDAERGFVYIADPSPFDFDPALVVYDVKGKRAWRILEDHPSVTAEDHHLVVRERFMKAFGLPLQIGVDSISLSPDGEHLIYGPLAGGTLWRIPTATLRTPPEDAEDGGEAVERLGPKPTTDGTITGPDGTTYLTAIEHDALATLSAEGELGLLVQSERLAWPDGVALSPDGWLYATCSELHKVIGEDLDEVPNRGPYRLVRVKVGE
jgi:sugar lactone lactonase YvrE